MFGNSVLISTHLSRFSLSPSWPLFRPPSTVVKEDRGKAIAMWMLLLAAFIAYVVYISLNAVETRKNPPVQILRKVFKRDTNGMSRFCDESATQETKPQRIEGRPSAATLGTISIQVCRFSSHRLRKGLQNDARNTQSAEHHHRIWSFGPAAFRPHSFFIHRTVTE